MSEVNHEEIVLAGVLPDNKHRLEVLIRKLTPKHFTDKTRETLYNLLDRYYSQTGSVLSSQHLSDLLRKKDAGTSSLYQETYNYLESIEVSDIDFSWSVEQLREQAVEKKLAEVILESMEILRNGITDEKTGETEEGPEDAKARLLAGIQTIDNELNSQDSPEGDLRDETSDILEDYQERKRSRLSGKSMGIKFGIPELDDKLGGMQKGELILVGAASGTGKSTLAVQAAWSAAVEQGKNVVFLTTETLRPQIRRKLVARHSKLPVFAIPEGLNTRDLKGGTLSPAQETKLEEVVKDFTQNESYGRIYIAQVPRNSTITSIEQTLIRIDSMFPIDFVVMDYLALLSSDRKRQTTREELAAIIKEAKQVATTFRDGEGVPLLSPWQLSRSAQEQAEKIGMYTTAALSETAEATNSSDSIITLMAPADNDSRYTEMTAQVVKNRDGETANGILVDVDYATSAFTSKSSSQRFPTAATSPEQGMSLLNL